MAETAAATRGSAAVCLIPPHAWACGWGGWSRGGGWRPICAGRCRRWNGLDHSAIKGWQLAEAAKYRTPDGVQEFLSRVRWDAMRCATICLPMSARILPFAPRLPWAAALAETDRPRGRWVTADSIYGADSALRRWLRARGTGYVQAVTKVQRLGPARVEDRVTELPAWQRRSAGVVALIGGADHPSPPGRWGQRHDWADLPYGSDAAPGWEKGLLIRRKLAEPGKLAFHLTHAAHGMASADLVRIAGTRWTIEAWFPTRTGLRPAGDPGFEAAKGEVGLDRYEVRSPRRSPDHRTCGDGSAACCGRWTGWRRHVTLAMLAHAHLAVLRKTVAGGGGHAGLGRHAPAADRPGNPPPALASRLATRARHRGSPRLVTLATAPSAAHTTLPLATAYAT